jgi:hypothetical protein
MVDLMADVSEYAAQGSICGGDALSYSQDVGKATTKQMCDTAIEVMNGICSKHKFYDARQHYKVVGRWSENPDNPQNVGKCTANILYLDDNFADQLNQYIDFNNPCCVQTGADAFNPDNCSRTRGIEKNTGKVPCCNGKPPIVGTGGTYLCQ